MLLVVSCWHSLCHILFLLICCHLLSFVVIRCHSLYHLLSVVVIYCTTRCHLFSLLPFVVTLSRSMYHSPVFLKMIIKKGLFKLIELDNIIFLMRKFKGKIVQDKKKQIVTVTDYNIWPAKLSGSVTFWLASWNFFLLHCKKSDLNLTFLKYKNYKIVFWAISVKKVTIMKKKKKKKKN